jgi:hypothetical protein
MVPPWANLAKAQSILRSRAVALQQSARPNVPDPKGWRKRLCAKMRGGWLKRKGAWIGLSVTSRVPSGHRGAGADPSAASLAPLSVRGQTRTRRAMSISLIIEHMLTKTRPVLPAGQVRPKQKGE